MDRQTIALIFQEGGRFITELIRTRPFKRPETVKQQPTAVIEQPPEVTKTGEGKASSVEAGVACVPCCNDHFSVCSGLISDEAIRMARRTGMQNDEIIGRINHCEDQLNAMEREDLSVEKIASLPGWEKEIAIYAQNQGAAIRHKLEGVTSVDDLEDVALQIKEARIKIGKDYFKGRLAHMSEVEKTEAGRRALEKLEEDLTNEQ